MSRVSTMQAPDPLATALTTFVRFCVLLARRAWAYLLGMTNTTFSVATYNVLANAYVKPERYRHSPPEALEPLARRARLLDRIAALEADVLCLQEVERDLHDAIAQRLGVGYMSAFAARTGRPDGASLFARNSVATWHGSEVLHYGAHASGDDQVALIARLAIGGRPVTIASTHLQWCAEGTPPEQHIGRAQLQELLDRRDDSTWIVGGDFNAISQSCVVVDALERKMALGAATQRPWDTCNANGRPRKLDYLLYTAGRLVPRPGTLPKLQRDTPMPSLTEPSDHLPLRIDFTLV